MTMYLVEVQKTAADKLEPVDVIVADDSISACEEADRRYARITHGRAVRPVAGNMIPLIEKGIKVCLGGATCSHKSDRPHLAKSEVDPDMKKIIDDLKQRQQ